MANVAVTALSLTHRCALNLLEKDPKGVIRDLYAHMPTTNYVKHLSPTVDAIEKYAISIMYQVPSDPTILAQQLKNIPTTN